MADTDDRSVLNLKLMVSQEIAAGLLLVLLNDENSLIRQHAIGFAQAYEQALQTATVADIAISFSPRKGSPAKGSPAKRTPEKFTALKKAESLGLLKTLLKVRLELI